MPRKKRKRKKWNLKGLITIYLRRIFMYSPLRAETLKSAEVKEKGNTLYKCATSGILLTRDKVTVDHKIPVTDIKKGFEDWNTYVKRLFCKVSNLQVISKDVHKAKTAKERKERYHARKKRDAVIDRSTKKVVKRRKKAGK